MDDEHVINPQAAPILVVIGVPTFGLVSMRWHMAMSRLQLMNFRTREIAVEGHEVGEARDYIVRSALEYRTSTGHRASHIFFVDDDVIVPPDALLRLLRHQLPIVGGLYYAKTKTPQPLVLNDSYCGVDEDWLDGELVRCAAHGMGCTLIQRSVFERIEPPWFVTTHAADATTKQHQTEDVHFCKKARAAGFQPTVDTGLFCWHWSAEERLAYPVEKWLESVA